MTLEDILTEQDYLAYARRRFFEQLVSGTLPKAEALVAAGRLGIELAGSHYAMLFLTLPPADAGAAADQARNSLLGFFLRYPAYIPVFWEPGTLLVLTTGDPDSLPEYISRGIAAVREQWRHIPDQDWHIAAGMPREGLDSIPGCYQQAARLWAFRYLLPQEHILTAETVDHTLKTEQAENLSEIDFRITDPALLYNFLNRGATENVPPFVDEYLRKMTGALTSDAFCHYLMLNARFFVLSFADAKGLSQELLLELLDRLKLPDGRVNPEALQTYLIGVLSAAIALRDTTMDLRRGPLRRAMDFIDKHFDESDLSLAQTARHAQLSPNYLSALFRQELDCTFTDFVTKKRMEEAQRLLRSTDKRIGEIAVAVGYKDSRYFSTLFKKTQGCTPRELRARRSLPGAHGARIRSYTDIATSI